MPQKIVSFGFKNGHPIAGEDENGGNFEIIDVRTVLFRNPFHDKKLRNLRGTDRAVQLDIQKTPGFAISFGKLWAQAENSTAKVVYFGCTGGHHRSVYIAELVAGALHIPVKHRDIDKGRQ